MVAGALGASPIGAAGEIEGPEAASLVFAAQSPGSPSARAPVIGVPTDIRTILAAVRPAGIRFFAPDSPEACRALAELKGLIDAAEGPTGSASQADASSDHPQTGVGDLRSVTRDGPTNTSCQESNPAKDSAARWIPKPMSALCPQGAETPWVWRGYSLEVERYSSPDSGRLGRPRWWRTYCALSIPRILSRRSSDRR
jgi:hypothetical protein